MQVTPDWVWSLWTLSLQFYPYDQSHWNQWHLSHEWSYSCPCTQDWGFANHPIDSSWIAHRANGNWREWGCQNTVPKTKQNASIFRKKTLIERLDRLVGNRLHVRTINSEAALQAVFQNELIFITSLYKVAKEAPFPLHQGKSRWFGGWSSSPITAILGQHQKWHSPNTDVSLYHTDTNDMTEVSCWCAQTCGNLGLEWTYPCWWWPRASPLHHAHDVSYAAMTSNATHSHLISWANFPTNEVKGWVLFCICYQEEMRSILHNANCHFSFPPRLTHKVNAIHQNYISENNSAIKVSLFTNELHCLSLHIPSPHQEGDHPKWTQNQWEFGKVMF